jgi:hypothetical protein
MRRRFPELVCACAVLFVSAFDLEADDETRGQSAVRTPGAESGRPGGVKPSSPKSLLLETGSVRSIETSEALPGASAGGLNARQQRVLDRVNYYRTMAGVAPVRADVKLLDAAQSHASYLGATGTDTETNKSNPYYTGYSPFDRIRLSDIRMLRQVKWLRERALVASRACGGCVDGRDISSLIIPSGEFTAGPGGPSIRARCRNSMSRLTLALTTSLN